MVNDALLPADPEVALAIGYAPVPARTRLKALWAFDTRLAAIVRTTSEPLIGRMRLTWWHDAVTATHGPAGEPVVAAVRGAGMPVAALARMVDGWEALLDAPIALGDYAAGRGGGLFAAAAAVLAASDAVDEAGAGWALVDLARHHSDAAVAGAALQTAEDLLRTAPARWSRSGRPLGALTKLARRDLVALEPQGAPRRVLAAAVLALTGR